MIRTEAWSFYRTISGVRLCWELEEPKGPKDISLTHPFVGNAVNRKQWGTYQGKGLCQRAQMKRLKHAESDHIVVPFVSDTLGSMSGASTVTMCLFAGCQAVQETEFFVKDWGDGAGAENGTSVSGGVEARSPPMGCAPDVGCLVSDRGEGHRPRENLLITRPA